MRRGLPTEANWERPLRTYEDMEHLLGDLPDDAIKYVPAPKTSEDDWLSGK